MPNQTQKQDFVYPDGLHFGVSTDGGSAFSDVGVMAAGATFTFNFDKQQIEPGNAAKPSARAKNMTLAVEPSALWSWDPEIQEKLSGGLFKRTAVAGTLVTGGVQTVDTGYTQDQTIELTGKNATGAIPSSIVVTEDPSGTPVVKTLGTDYEIVKDANGQWAIVILSSGTMVNTLNFQVVSDYTPATGAYISAGSSSKVISPVVIRLRHYTDVALTTYDFELLVYRAEMNAGIQFAKKGSNEDGLDEITIGMTGEIDDDQANDEQLFSMFIAA